MHGMTRLLLTAALAILTAGASVAPASAEGTLDRIRQSGEIRLAYRADAAPFSFVKDGVPAGYSVELCRIVADALKSALALDSLQVSFVEVSAADRFAALAEDRADLLCEATTATLARREAMDFSIPTYVSGAGMVIRPDGPASVEDFSGRKLGVLGGTTTERDIKALLAGQNIQAELKVAKSHDEGFSWLRAGEVSAYFGDRAILEERLRAETQAGDLLLADQYLTIEPYGLAMRIDAEFRLAVDRALSHLFRSGGMIKVFRKSVDPQAKPSELLKALSRMSGLPE